MYLWPRKLPDNPLANWAGEVTFLVGCVGLALMGLGGDSDSRLGELGFGALLVAAAASFVAVVAWITGWGDRTDHRIDINVTHNEAVTTLRIAGDLNHVTRQVLSHQLEELISQGNCNFVVDLEQIDDFDSTGLGTLVAALKRVRQQGGQLTVVCTRQSLREVFDMTGLSDLFGIADSGNRR